MHFLIFDTNKFSFETKYDSILWNHFLFESKIMKRDKRLAIIAINYSLLRRHTRRGRWSYDWFSIGHLNSISIVDTIVK